MACLALGLLCSPKLKLAVQESTKTFTTIISNSSTERDRVSLNQGALEIGPDTMAEKQRLESLIQRLDLIKAQYENELVSYKKLDKSFTELVMNSRKNPDKVLIQKKQSELDQNFESLNLSLKEYQKISQEIYKFQSENLKNDLKKNNEEKTNSGV